MEVIIMSRSFKKEKIVKDHNKGMKQFANKKVRCSDDIPSGNSYKKVFNSWDISDYSFRCNDNCKNCNEETCDYKRK
jgi:hypothetical protein